MILNTSVLAYIPLIFNSIFVYSFIQNNCYFFTIYENHTNKSIAKGLFTYFFHQIGLFFFCLYCPRRMTQETWIYLESQKWQHSWLSFRDSARACLPAWLCAFPIEFAFESTDCVCPAKPPHQHYRMCPAIPPPGDKAIILACCVADETPNMWMGCSFRGCVFFCVLRSSNPQTAMEMQ